MSTTSEPTLSREAYVNSLIAEWEAIFLRVQTRMAPPDGKNVSDLFEVDAGLHQHVYMVVEWSPHHGGFRLVGYTQKADIAEMYVGSYSKLSYEFLPLVVYNLDTQVELHPQITGFMFDGHRFSDGFRQPLEGLYSRWLDYEQVTP
jgi:hypothetical protein